MNKKNIFATLLALTLFSSIAYATQDIQVIGNMPIKITLENGTQKIVQVKRLQTSPQFKARFAAQRNQRFFRAMSTSVASDKLPDSKGVGMNNVPVLDQGQHGACATFATTGAIDALKGLYHDKAISQVCNMALGLTVDSDARDKGGWAGYDGEDILKQIVQYGYLPLSYQTTKGCGGLKVYPLNDALRISEPMSIAKFTAHSNKSIRNKDWHSLASPYDAFPKSANAATKILTSVKKALNQGKRIVFGAMLWTQEGGIGNFGYYGDVNYPDAWVMTSTIEKDMTNLSALGGHAMIIVGYNDKACATYDDNEEPRKACGLLHLRNSWGPDAGINGDYFMTYNYFKHMLTEASVVG